MIDIVIIHQPSKKINKNLNLQYNAIFCDWITPNADMWFLNRFATLHVLT